MARPAKKGLDYFSHDTDASTSREIEYIEATFGLTGYAVYLKILEKIYGHEGYYVPWTDIDAAIFSKRCGVDLQTLKAIIETCLEIDLFDRWVFDANQVLTSASIQRRFLQATEKRTKSEISPVLRVSASETPLKRDLSEVSASETPPETENERVSVSESTQSKVKESKEEKKPCAPADARQDDFTLFWDAFNYKRGREPAWIAWKRIKSYTQDLVVLILKAAREEALRRPALIADKKTPKMAQGWITDKRWEDELAIKFVIPKLTIIQQQEEDEWSAALSQT